MKEDSGGRAKKFSLRMEAAVFSKMLVRMYQNVRPHIKEASKYVRSLAAVTVWVLIFIIINFYEICAAYLRLYIRNKELFRAYTVAATL